MSQYETISNKLLQTVRLSWEPVAIKFFKPDDNPGGLMRRSKKLSFCQFVSAAATGGYTLLVTPENLGCPNARLAFGFVDPKVDEEAMAKIVKSHVGVYAPDEASARRIVEAKPSIPPGEVGSIGVTPLGKANFDPDAVIFTVVPAQAYYILDGYLYAEGEVPVRLECGTNSLTCAYGAVVAGYYHRINMVTGCTGGRIYAGMDGSQVQLFFPGQKLAALLSGLEARSKRVSYPDMPVMPAPIPQPSKHILQPE
ncbi:MAG: DUF169 domain-containing protein [Chloroflexota bacterium]